MNSCCPDFSPEHGCAHWGPEKSNDDPFNTAHMTDRELEAHRSRYGIERPR